MFLRIFIIFISLIPFISCNCNETQIDINSANISELDKIINIGPTIAQRIIDSRPFSSVDELIKVKGIGNITLDEIKQQGLACVSEESSEKVEEKKIVQEEEKIEEDIEKQGKQMQNNEIKNISNVSEERDKAYLFYSEGVNLTNNKTKSIKSEENKETLQRTLSLLGIVTIILFVMTLILLKELKNRKNEFN